MRKIFLVVGMLFLASVVVSGAVAAQSNRSENFTAPLNTIEEVPEPSGFARNPRGLAKFSLSHDGETLHFQLNVANIDNVRMAHIHLGACGETGDVVVWLYPEGPPFQLIPGTFNGVLASGEITAGSLVGPLAGADLDELLEEMRTGGAYVNVHTEQNPPGEIRGQITYRDQRGC